MAAYQPDEHWRCVVGFETRYLVSETGRVFSLVRRKLIAQFIDENNRRQLCLSLGGGVQKSVHADVLVAEAFHGPRPYGHVVRHLDGDTLNSRFDNLTWCPAGENLARKAKLKESA